MLKHSRAWHPRHPRIAADAVLTRIGTRRGSARLDTLSLGHHERDILPRSKQAHETPPTHGAAATGEVESF
ncbi:MAG: hypothetical protein R3B96_06500 [Pirellulaceae bacterium]